MKFLYFSLALAIGLASASQAAINNQLKLVLGGSTLLAALVSFVVGSLCLFVLCLLSGQTLSVLGNLPQASWWMLTGGLLGALFVFGTILLAPKLGLAAMLSLIILGQLSTSLALDHFAWIGMPLREMSWWRLGGTLLILAGVVLVNFGDRLEGLRAFFK